jgi:hypothetical protein
MRLTIIVEDNTVYVDGESFSGFDMTNIPSEIRAFQWFGSFGELEYHRIFENGVISHPQNQTVTELPDWALEVKEQWDLLKSAFTLKMEQILAEERYQASLPPTISPTVTQ